MKTNSKLLIISSNFPYGIQGDNAFIKHEIDTLAKNFNSVSIIATNDDSEISYGLPDNTKVSQVNISKKSLGSILKSCLNMFSIEAIKEFMIAKRKYKQKGNIYVVKSIFRYYYAYNKLKKSIIKDLDSDTICYSYWLSSRAFALSKLKKKGKLNNKIVSRCHGFDCYLSVGYQPFRDEMLKYIDEIYFVSDTGKNDFSENYLPNCINPLSKLRVARLASSTDSSINPSVKGKVLRIVTCSNLIKVKRIDRIIDAIAEIDDIEINWTHYGTGVLEQELKDYSHKKLSEKKNTKYKFNGYTKQSDILSAYQKGNYDLFINASESEGIPMSIMEAYAVGLPVIAYDVGGTHEIVSDEDFLINKDLDFKALAEAIRKFNQLSAEEVFYYKEKVNKIFKKKYSLKNYDDFAKQIKLTSMVVATSNLDQFDYANVDVNKDYGNVNFVNLYTPCNNLFTKVLRRAWYKFNVPCKYIWYDKKYKFLIKYTNKIVLFDSILGYEILSYTKKNSFAELNFWYWNIVGNTANKLNYIAKYAKIWSFDKSDCERYNLNYNHQFYGDKRQMSASINLPRIIFVGRDKNRLDGLLKLAKYNEENNIDYSMYILTNKNMPTSDNLHRVNKFIPYDKVFDMIEHSSCIIDFLQEGQYGLTLRTLEGLFNGRKVITNNKLIVNEELYNPNLILVLDENMSNIDQIKSFVSSSKVSFNATKLENYTFTNWLKGFI